MTVRDTKQFKIISHRGNISGPNQELENNPNYIDAAIGLGYDVEIDVWKKGQQYYLGHDAPSYKISLMWLEKRKKWLWCHAKNYRALESLLSNRVHCFWHQQDDCVLTSKKIIWCYPEKIIKSGILVVKGNSKINFKKLKSICSGVCTDYPCKFKER